MSAAEIDRLAALEVALVGAAAAQAQRRRRRRRRTALLAAVAGPLALASVGSIAATGFFGGIDRNLSMLRDERLVPTVQVTPEVAGPTGTRPDGRQSGRSFRVDGHRVIGYRAKSGKFCYIFIGHTGGCLAPGGINRDNPVAWNTDHGGRVFNVYGLVIDGVESMSVRFDGVNHPVAVAHNAFFFESLGLTDAGPFTFTLILTYRDGTTRSLPLRASDATTARSKAEPKLPGALAPVGDAAA